MPADHESPSAAYEDAARDIAGLLALIHRHLAAHASGVRQRGANWTDAGDLQALRSDLIVALIPTRNCQMEAEARGEVLAALAKVRPARF